VKKITPSTKTKLGQGLLKGLKEVVTSEQRKMNLRNSILEISDNPPEFKMAQIKEKSNDDFDYQIDIEQLEVKNMDSNFIRIIYVELMDEGSPVMRPTKGEEVEAGIYRLLPTPDYDPVDEHWEFLPGSIVRCFPKKLQNGEEILVARELIAKE
jgi:hypothetical protein